MQNIDELRAFHRAHEFKLEVYHLIDESPLAQQDFKFRSQLMESAASNEMNIREGFSRFLAREIMQFASIALGSLAEAIGRVNDGIERRYFRREDCEHAFELGEASKMTTQAWLQSLEPFARKSRRRKPRSPRRPDPGLRTPDFGRRGSKTP